MIQNKNIKASTRNNLLLVLAFAIISLVALFQFGVVSANTQVINYNVVAGQNKDAQFVIQTLKYEPYPVAAGSWFNVWIKVQNIGQDDAKNAVIELVPTYPFSSQDKLVRNYGLISGTINAHNQMKPDETSPQSNQIILKYRVYVNPNTEGGKYMLKIRISSDKNGGSYYTYNLPIEVAKSKVSFNIAFQNYNGAQSSFTITNIGEEPANNIIVEINGAQWKLNNKRSVNLGDLNNGDSTLFAFSGNPDEKQIKLNVSYSDISGTRRSVVQNINVGNIKTSLEETQPFGYMDSLIFLIGMIIGVFIIVASRKIHRKKRGN